jgi:hypothetical protein
MPYRLKVRSRVTDSVRAFLLGDAVSIVFLQLSKRSSFL